ncbi:MAG TPA: Rieske (2Fe-2S) protein [Symbiobacteriaceae bacterium]|nr:Rieske (2Fe-2S) protein [Symbiobacteriaceae bacterium]
MLRQVYRRMVTVIHRDEEHRLNRRAFVHLLFLCSAALGLAAVPLATLARWAERSGPKRAPEPTGQPIARADQVPPGQALNFNWPTENDPAVLLHLPEGGFVAYDRRCTHLLCPVLWDPQMDHLVCPCHDGHFNARTGAVLYGPPRRPLAKIPIAEHNGVVYVLGGENRGVKTDGS